MVNFINKKRPIGLFLLLTVQSLIFGQIVSDIQIKGLKKTKQYIVHREIHHEVDTPIDSIIAQSDRDRLDNLGIFSEVTWSAIPLENGSILLQYNVVESWNNIKGAMPVYSEEYGWSVTGGYIIKNFGGRNQMLEMGGSIGGQDSYGFRFYDPWIFGDHVSAEIGLFKSANNHIFLNRVKSVSSLSFGIGRYFNKNIRTNIEMELEEKVFSNDEAQFEESFKYVSLFSSLGYDSRDVYANPSKGIKVTSSFYWQIDHVSKEKNRFVWNHSSSLFRTIIPGNKKWIIGFNIANQLSFGNQNEVWMDYIGGGYSIRGWKMPTPDLYQSKTQSYRFGHHWVQASTELRKVIIPKYATKYGNELGLDLGFFIDAGMSSIERESLLKNTPLLGTGFGIRIPMPMMGVLRLDYGWAFYEGDHIESSFHLAMGQRF